MKSFPILAVVVLAGCASAPAAPTLSAVSPSRVSAFLPTEILIQGAGITHGISADLDRPSRSTFPLDLRVRLIGPTAVELLAERLSPTEVLAQVPAMLPVGRYTIELSTARGMAWLVEGLEVADCLLDCERGPDDGGCFSWLDADQDSYGRPGSGAAICLDDAGTRAGRGGDCRDTNPAIYPGAIELCNRLDDDCDGVKDEECVIDAGWKVRPDTGGNGSDWETATNHGRGRVWLGENQQIYARPGSGAFSLVGAACANRLISSWADPLGRAYFGGEGSGGEGVITSRVIGEAGCGTTQNLGGTAVVGLQGFGSRLYGATRDGLLLAGPAGSVSLGPGLGPGVIVNDVQGASEEALFAVGSAGLRPKAWRLVTDGGAFVDEGVEALAVPDQALTAVWAVDETRAYAVGAQGALLERTSGTWRALPPAGGGLRAVRAFGAGSVYAATGDGRVLRFDGTSWEELYRHPVPAVFTDITASAEDDIWVVGHDGLVVHWYE